MAILSREQHKRMTAKEPPKRYEWSRDCGGIRFYYRKAPLFTHTTQWWSFVHNKWITDI